MSVLAVVPVRVGSHRIPNKAMRVVAGKTLLGWTLDTLSRTRGVARTVVCTNDRQVAGWCRVRGIEVLGRPAQWDDPDVPVIDVAVHAQAALDWQGKVLLAQPTNPLLDPRDYEYAINSPKTPVVGTTSRPGFVNYVDGTRFVNADWRSGVGFYVFDSNQALPISRHGWTTVAVPRERALDVDWPEDLAVARVRRTPGPILLHVLAGGRWGMGHLHRCVALANELAGYDIEWSWAPGTTREACNFARQRFGINAPLGIAPLDGCPVIVSDALDTTRDQVLKWQTTGSRVLTFEDLGEGSRFADAVVDDLYGHREDRHHPLVYSGAKYAVVRSEFIDPPTWKPGSGRVLVTFGGTDPAGMTAKVVSAMFPAHGSAFPEIRVVPPFATELAGDDQMYDDPLMLSYARGEVSMVEEMLASDLVITSAGRTVYEAAALGVPVVSIPVNERESRHFHVPGVAYFGSVWTFNARALAELVQRLLGDHAQLLEMSQQMRRSVDGKGARRVARIVEGLAEGL